MSDCSTPKYVLPESLPTDPILADLLPDFASQWLHDLTVTWAELRTNNDVEGLRRFGHTIKGSFLQFGFKQLAGAGKDIMQCADEGNWDGAKALVLELRSAMEQLLQRVGTSS